MNEIPIEAKKDGLAQLQDGCWKLILKVHLNDMPTWLMSAPMGTRLACAIVEIGDDEQPVPHKDEAKVSRQKEIYAAKSEGEKAVTRAVMLCKDDAFWTWIENTYDFVVVPFDSREWLLVVCGINSRSELATNYDALGVFLRIEQDYREATGQLTEQRS